MAASKAGQNEGVPPEPCLRIPFAHKEQNKVGDKTNASAQANACYQPNPSEHEPHDNAERGGKQPLGNAQPD